LRDKKEWLVADKYCKGCKYYGKLSSSGIHGYRCCDYTYYTGKIRQNPPKTCEVMVKGPRPRGFQSTDGCVVRRIKGV
jgi:hypothetical protein